MRGRYGLRVIRRETSAELLSGNPSAPAGAWLAFYDPDAYNGRGCAEWTDDPALALRFLTPEDAFRCWKRVSSVRPWREDGRANRPLTAYSVLSERLP